MEPGKSYIVTLVGGSFIILHDVLGFYGDRIDARYIIRVGEGRIRRIWFSVSLSPAVISSISPPLTHPETEILGVIREVSSAGMMDYVTGWLGNKRAGIEELEKEIWEK